MSCFRKIITFALILLASSLFAEEWHVCLGSFRKKENADALVNKLKAKDISAGIATFDVDGKPLYRVFESGAASTAEEARIYRRKLEDDSMLEELGITGLWICQGSPDKNENTEEILLKNEEIPLSKEVPYSVLVRSYAEEKTADNDCEKLKKQEIDSYVLKKYDDKSYFKFDLHAGAFENEEDAEDLQEKLESLGVEGTEVADFNDFSEALEKYNQVITEEKVHFNDYSDEFPDFYSESVKSLITDFPINSDYQLERIIVCDVKNVEKNDYRTKLVKLFEKFNEKIDFTPDEINSGFNSFAASELKNNLYKKSVYIFFGNGKDLSSNIDRKEDVLPENNEKLTIKIHDKDINAELFSDDDVCALIGFSESKDIFLYALSYELDAEEMKDYFLNIQPDKNLLSFPQIRRTALVFPDNTEEMQQDFCILHLTKLDSSYAEQKNYSDWAIPMVGHWESSFFMTLNTDNLLVSFFDLDYDYNAKKIHGMFMGEHEKETETDSNHSVNVNNVKGWFVNNFFIDPEVSFSSKSYILAVSSENINSLDEDELIEYAETMKIW